MKVILGKRITTLLFAIVMMLVTFVVDAAELKIVYPENGLYSLQPMCAPSKELTVHNASTTNGANVIIWDINSNWHTQPSHQKWYVLRIGNTEWYKILAENSGSALNIHNGIAANGTNVSIWPFGGNMHKFRFLNAGNGYYVLQGHVNGAYVLDVSGASNTNGANVQIYQFNNSGAQKWKLVQRYKRWSGYAKKTLKAYKDYQLRSQHASYERVDKGDLLVVLNEKGGAYFVQYKTSNGSTKERWVSKDVFKENTQPVIKTTFSAPVTNYYICGNDWGKYYSAKKNYHLGLDIKSSTGDKNIYATADGTVVQTGWNSANGNTITLEHKLNGSTIYSFYAHLSQINVSKNTKVKRGQKIGVIGTTGSSSTGVHLHFGITNQKSAGTYGYGSVSGNIGTRAGYKFYNPKYVLQYGRLP